MSVPADRSRLRVEGRPPARVRSCSASSSETAAERLTDELLLEILPRVPAKSLCRFNCVSKHWRSLIDHPDHRKKLPQTLAGFLYRSLSTNNGPGVFWRPPVLRISVSGSPGALVSTSLAFLPNHDRFDILDCCNGLLLCRLHHVFPQIREFEYVVCNPFTEKWVTLPFSKATDRVLITRLAFDPVQSSHFHVFELLNDLDSLGVEFVDGVAVYSSETEGWVHKKEKWNQRMRLPYGRTDIAETVFLNGHLYFHTLGHGNSKCLAAVDMDGETWTNFGVPGGGLIEGSIQLSHGRLHYANFYRDEDNGVVRLAVYVLENYESEEWVRKHIAETSYLFGEIDVVLDWNFKFVGIHPECNLIFFIAGWDNTFMCYNMDRRQVKVICNLQDGKRPYLPYVPLYAAISGG